MANLFSQKGKFFQKIFDAKICPAPAPLPSFGPPAALALPTDQKSLSRGLLSAPVCVSFLRVDARAGWWRQRRRQLQLRRCQTCKKCSEGTKSNENNWCHIIYAFIRSRITGISTADLLACRILKGKSLKNFARCAQRQILDQIFENLLTVAGPINM